MEYEAVKLINERTGSKRRWEEEESQLLLKVMRYLMFKRVINNLPTSGTRLQGASSIPLANAFSGRESSAVSSGSTT